MNETYTSPLKINMLGAMLLTLSTAVVAEPAGQRMEEVLAAYDSAAMPVASDRYQFSSLLDVEKEVVSRMLEIASTLLTSSHELDSEFSSIVDREFWNIR